MKALLEEMKQIHSEMGGLLDDIAGLPEDEQRRIAWKMAEVLKTMYQRIEDAQGAGSGD